MGIPKGPTEGGSGGRRGHSGMEHWGYTDEVKSAARRRRRLIDKKVVNEQAADQPPDASSETPSQDSIKS